MGAKVYIDAMYRLLNMPVYEDEGSMTIGEFCPTDTPSLIEEISALRVKQVKEILESGGLYAENYSEVSKRLFHTYKDFLLVQRNETPKKGEYISAGHSLGLYPSNHWGYLEYLQVVDAQFAGFFFRKFSAQIADSDRERHLYVLGSSGSGKTELLKVIAYANMRRKGFCTTIVLDPHGDFGEQVGKWKENIGGDDVVYIDPLLKEGFTPVMNPFELKNPTAQKVDRMCQEFTAVFQELLGDSALTNQMEALLYPCLSVILWRGGNLADVQRFMDDENNEDLVEYGKRLSMPSHRDFFESGKFYTSTYARTKASIYTKLQSLLNYQTFYSLMMGKSTIDIEQLMNSRKLVVFNLSKGNLGRGTMEVFGRFLVALFQVHALGRAEIPEYKRVPVHLILDEFQNFVSPSIEEVLTESRKYKLHLTLAQQQLGQGMDTKIKNIVVGNTHVKVMGVNTRATITPMSKELEVEEEALLKLKVGQFFVRCRGKPAFKLYAPRFLLGTKNAMSASEWEAVVEKQVARYYGKYEPIPVAPQENDVEQVEEILESAVSSKEKPEQQSLQETASSAEKSKATKKTSKPVKTKSERKPLKPKLPL